MHQTQWSPERPLPPPVSLASQSHHEKPPEVTCTSRGNPGFPASTRESPRETFFNTSRGQIPLPWLGSNDALPLATRMGNMTSLAPHEWLPELAVVPREKTHTGAASREKSPDDPVIARWGLSFPAWPEEPSRVFSANSTGGLTPFRTLRGSKIEPSRLGRRAQFLLPLEMRPDSLGESGMQPRDSCRPWRGTLASAHKPR